MQKDKKSEKNDLLFEYNAQILKETQQIKALGLCQLQIETASILEAYNVKTAADLLDRDGDIKETAEESRRYAAATLTKSQAKAAHMLKDVQLLAAKDLDNSEVKAASALRAKHTEVQQKEEEKNEVISWLSGDYCLSSKHDQ